MKNKLKLHPGNTQPLFLLGIIILMVVCQAILLPGTVTIGQMLLVSRQASALGIIALGDDTCDKKGAAGCAQPDLVGKDRVMHCGEKLRGTEIAPGDCSCAVSAALHQ